MTNQIGKLKHMLKKSHYIVFLGGAGVSTESGIPDFRSENGIFNAVKKYAKPPETLLSRVFFEQNTEVFYDYYKTMLYTDVKPNAAHLALAKLEHEGRLKAVITQNIDGLHQKAGSTKVYELHGSIYRNYCIGCGKQFDVEFIKSSAGVPRCECTGIIKPDVVLYGESLNEQTLFKAMESVAKADMLIIGGTSLMVYPAAGLIDYYIGNRLVLINKGSTGIDGAADLVINAPIGEVLYNAVCAE